MYTLCFILLILRFFNIGSAAAEDAVDKARLPAALQKSTERHAIEGAILEFDSSTGNVARLYPTKVLPMVWALRDHFLLCTDLRDKSGRTAPLDVCLRTAGKFMAASKPAPITPQPEQMPSPTFQQFAVNDTYGHGEVTCNLAQELGIAIIAEGFEDETSVRILQECGVRYGQGYLFSKPMSQAAFEIWHSNRIRGAAPSIQF